MTAEMDVDFDAREDGGVLPGVALPARQLLRPDVQRRRLGGGAHALRAAHRRRPHARRDAADHEPDVGELNASHSGIAGRRRHGRRPTGRLGLRFDRAEYEANGRLRITEVIPFGAGGARRASRPGDVPHRRRRPRRSTRARTSTSCCDTRSASASCSDRCDRRGRDAARRRGPPDQRRRPRRRCSIAQWVEANARYVAKASGGRLGYVHMFDMGAGSLAQLYLDLDAENQARDGVVDRRAQQQRRLRQRLRDRRLRAARLPDDDAARLRRGARRARCSASARSSCRRSS